MIVLGRWKVFSCCPVFLLGLLDGPLGGCSASTISRVSLLIRGHIPVIEHSVEDATQRKLKHGAPQKRAGGKYGADAGVRCPAKEHLFSPYKFHPGHADIPWSPHGSPNSTIDATGTRGSATR